MGKVTFLGVEGSGKTVLTMGLVNSFKALEQEGLFLRPDSRESYRFLMQQSARLEEGVLPSQTATFKRLAWTIVEEEEPIRQMDVLDFPGEVYRLAFLDAADDPDPEGFKERVEAHQDEINELLGYLSQSDEVFVLFNLDDARNQIADSDHLDAVWVTNACLDYLHRIPSRPSISLVLTQLDRYPEFDCSDLKGSLMKWIPLIAHNFPHINILPVAAMNSDLQSNGMMSVIDQILSKVSRRGQAGTDEDSQFLEYSRLASQGDFMAQCNVGICYLEGKGVSCDYQKAVDYFLRAAEHGLSDAQYNLGWCFQNGIGVQRDNQKAMNWFRKAASQGDQEALAALNELAQSSGPSPQQSPIGNTGTQSRAGSEDFSYTFQEPTPQLDELVLAQRKVGFLEAWKMCWTNWKFQGRSSRTEYWHMFDWLLLIRLISAFIPSNIITDLLFGLFDLIVLIPFLCLSVRRLHDIGKSGWWELLDTPLILAVFIASLAGNKQSELSGLLCLIGLVGGLILLHFRCKPSQEAENQYGPIPNLTYLPKSLVEKWKKREKLEHRICVAVLVCFLIIILVAVLSGLRG